MTTLEQLNARGSDFLPGYMGIVFTGFTERELRAELAVRPPEGSGCLNAVS